MCHRACAGGGAFGFREMEKPAGIQVPGADGGGDVSGIFDAVLLFHLLVLSGCRIWCVDVVEGEEAVELLTIWCEPGGRVCAGLSDISVLSWADVPGAERGAGHGEFL